MWSGFLASEVDPVFATQSHWPNGVLRGIGTQLQDRMIQEASQPIPQLQKCSCRLWLERSLAESGYERLGFGSGLIPGLVDLKGPLHGRTDGIDPSPKAACTHFFMLSLNESSQHGKAASRERPPSCATARQEADGRMFWLT